MNKEGLNVVTLVGFKDGDMLDEGMDVEMREGLFDDEGMVDGDMDGNTEGKTVH